MVSLPIVQRELMVASRGLGSWLWRWIVAIVAVAFGGLWLLLATLNQFGGGAGMQGDIFFAIMSWACFGYCLLSGLWTTTDSLTREKADGTLGLLFLTDLRGYDVVLGKMFTGSLRSFYGVLAVMPVLRAAAADGRRDQRPVLANGWGTVEHPRFLALGRHLFFRVVQSNGEIHFLDALPAGEHHDHPADFHRSWGNGPGAEPAQSRACDVPSSRPGDWRGSRVGMVSALDRVRVGGVRDAADSRLTHHPASMAGSTGASICFCRSVQRIQCGRSGQVSSDRASGKQPGVVAGQPKRLDADLPRVDAGLHHHHLAGDDHSDPLREVCTAIRIRWFQSGWGHCGWDLSGSGST